jgi:hypothetical protein
MKFGCTQFQVSVLRPNPTVTFRRFHPLAAGRVATDPERTPNRLRLYFERRS